MHQSLLDQETGAELESISDGPPEPVVELEIGLPERLAVGRGNSFVVGGHCFQPRARTRELAVEVADERTPVVHFSLPRLDAFERVAGETDSPGELGRNAYHSGFVALPRLAPRAASGEADVRLVLTGDDGNEVAVPLGSMRIEAGTEVPATPAPRFPGPAGTRVAICMATFEPPPELFRRQLDSIREQTHANWVCLISDDGSSASAREAIRREIDGDERFLLHEGEHLGFYENFERALAMAPESADHVTLCDQDDRWHPDKLERLLARMDDGVQLAYSDARVVDADGAVIHPSYWTTRRNNHTNLASLLIANSVTGAASLFRRDLLDDVLPFPPRIAKPYHDHWLSLVALARGRIAYVEEPLYDYVQHSDAVIGHTIANRRPVPARVRMRERLRRPGTGSRIVYFYVWSQHMLFAQVLRDRCWDRMARPKRRALRRFLSVDTSLRGLAWMQARRLRRIWGWNETLDIERFLAKALLRQRLVSLRAAGRRRPPRWLPRDASIPPYSMEDA